MGITLSRARLSRSHLMAGYPPDPELGTAASDVLRLLDRYYDDRPLTAAEIAEAIGLTPGGKRESKRRSVRDAIAELRNKGFRVCGANDGYWLGRHDGEYGEYLEAVRSRARYRFLAARLVGEAASDRKMGQGELF